MPQVTCALRELPQLWAALQHTSDRRQSLLCRISSKGCFRHNAQLASYSKDISKSQSRSQQPFLPHRAAWNPSHPPLAKTTAGIKHFPRAAPLQHLTITPCSGRGGHSGWHSPGGRQHGVTGRLQHPEGIANRLHQPAGRLVSGVTRKPPEPIHGRRRNVNKHGGLQDTWYPGQGRQR